MKNTLMKISLIELQETESRNVEDYLSMVLTNHKLQQYDPETFSETFKKQQGSWSSKVLVGKKH